MVKIYLSLIAVLLALPVWAADPCLDCHRDKTPYVVTQWQASAHGDRVGCRDCHQGDHEGLKKGEAPVRAALCGQCHPRALKEHQQSKHGLGLHAGWGCTRNLPAAPRGECAFCHEQGSSLPKAVVQCARFLKQSAPMREAGCNRCHRVETDCQSCHSSHSTDLKAVRNPAICAKCHMGPDHPQWEAWQTSSHGIQFASYGAEVAPGCQQCHMVRGSHNVSYGISATPGGKEVSLVLKDRRRAEMLGVCQQCHTARLAGEEMRRADAIRRQGLVLVARARRQIERLSAADALTPSLSERPPHPQKGAALALGPEMLYEDISAVEALFFRLKKFDFSKSWKGAFHQNPAYTHWYGNAELKLKLAEIESEVEQVLRGPASSLTPAGKVEDQVEYQLQLLQQRHAAGELSRDAYDAARRELLQNLPER